MFLLFAQCMFSTDYRAREDVAWNRRCVGIEAMVHLNQLASTAGSLPKVARMDLAALVLNRKKLSAEPIRFGTI